MRGVVESERWFEGKIFGEGRLRVLFLVVVWCVGCDIFEGFVDWNFFRNVVNWWCGRWYFEGVGMNFVEWFWFSGFCCVRWSLWSWGYVYNEVRGRVWVDVCGMWMMRMGWVVGIFVGVGCDNLVKVLEVLGLYVIFWVVLNLWFMEVLFRESGIVVWLWRCFICFYLCLYIVVKLVVGSCRLEDMIYGLCYWGFIWRG